MRYSLYIDRVFMMHFAVDVCLLFLTAKSGGIDCKKKRIFGAAAAGAGIVTAALAAPLPLGSGALRLALKLSCLAAGAAAQIWFAFSCRDKRTFRRAAMLYGACACIVGGALGAAKGLWGMAFSGTGLSPAAAGQAAALHGQAAVQRGNLTDSFAAAAFCAMAAVVGSRIVAAERRRSRSPLWKVSFCRNGRVFEGIGLLDSGNGLYDPYTGKPVCIIDPSEAGKLGLLDKNAPLRLIPYNCVGKSHGLMRAVIVDEMYLEKDGQEKRNGQAILAVSPEPLSASGSYQVILHPALLEEKKGANHDIKSSDAGKHAV